MVGIRRAILDLGPALSGEVHFPFLLLKTFTFTGLAYIYQGPLWAKETSLKTAVPTCLHIQTLTYNLVHVTVD